MDDTVIYIYMSFQPHDSGNIVAALNEDLVSIHVTLSAKKEHFD